MAHPHTPSSSSSAAAAAAANNPSAKQPVVQANPYVSKPAANPYNSKPSNHGAARPSRPAHNPYAAAANLRAARALPVRIQALTLGFNAGFLSLDDYWQAAVAAPHLVDRSLLELLRQHTWDRKLAELLQHVGRAGFPDYSVSRANNVLREVDNVAVAARKIIEDCILGEYDTFDFEEDGTLDEDGTLELQPSKKHPLGGKNGNAQSKKSKIGDYFGQARPAAAKPPPKPAARPTEERSRGSTRGSTRREGEGSTAVVARSASPRGLSALLEELCAKMGGIAIPRKGTVHECVEALQKLVKPEFIVSHFKTMDAKKQRASYPNTRTFDSIPVVLDDAIGQKIYLAQIAEALGVSDKTAEVFALAVDPLFKYQGDEHAKQGPSSKAFHRLHNHLHCQNNMLQRQDILGKTIGPNDPIMRLPIARNTPQNSKFINALIEAVLDWCVEMGMLEEHRPLVRMFLSVFLPGAGMGGHSDAPKASSKHLHNMRGILSIGGPQTVNFYAVEATPDKHSGKRIPGLGHVIQRDTGAHFYMTSDKANGSALMYHRNKEKTKSAKGKHEVMPIPEGGKTSITLVFDFPVTSEVKAMKALNKARSAPFSLKFNL